MWHKTQKNTNRFKGSNISVWKQIPQQVTAQYVQSDALHDLSGSYKIIHLLHEIGEFPQAQKVDFLAVPLPFNHYFLRIDTNNLHSTLTIC